MCICMESVLATSWDQTFLSFFTLYLTKSYGAYIVSTLYITFGQLTDQCRFIFIITSRPTHLPTLRCVALRSMKAYGLSLVIKPQSNI